MQKTKSVARCAFQRFPVIARALQQRQGADHIGLHERCGAVDRAIDVAFRCEIHDRIRTMLGEHLRDESAIADIALHEHMVGIAVQHRQGVEIARIGQRIEIDDAHAARNGVEHKITADETGTAGYEPCRHLGTPVGGDRSSKNSRQNIVDKNMRGHQWRCPHVRRPVPRPADTESERNIVVGEIVRR